MYGTVKGPCDQWAKPGIEWGGGEICSTSLKAVFAGMYGRFVGEKNIA